MVSATSNSTIIFIDLTLTPSINKDNLSSFDSTNNSSTYPFIDSVKEPCLVPEVCPSSILHVDPNIVPSFNLNHDPSGFPSSILGLLSTDPNQQQGTIKSFLSTIVASIVPDFNSISNIYSSFRNIFKI